jgi:hypothetical protein
VEGTRERQKLGVGREGMVSNILCNSSLIQKFDIF